MDVLVRCVLCVQRAYEHWCNGLFCGRCIECVKSMQEQTTIVFGSVLSIVCCCWCRLPILRSTVKHTLCYCI